jgi:hypothetical protein
MLCVTELGFGVLRSLIDAHKSDLITPNTVVIPQCAFVYCMAIELKTKAVEGFDMDNVWKFVFSLFSLLYFPFFHLVLLFLLLFIFQLLSLLR